MPTVFQANIISIFLDAVIMLRDYSYVVLITITQYTNFMYVVLVGRATSFDLSVVGSIPTGDHGSLEPRGANVDLGPKPSGW